MTEFFSPYQTRYTYTARVKKLCKKKNEGIKHRQQTSKRMKAILSAAIVEAVSY